MSLLEKLKSWMNAEDEAGLPFEATAYGVRELEPMELVRSAVSSVAANAKKWPDGVDLPDVVEVWLSAQDYEYYGPRRTSCEKRIADAVIAYAEEEGALLERVPTVIMQVDPSLLLGDVRTQARFSNPDEPIVRPATAKRAPEPVRTGPVGGVKTQLFRPNAEQAQSAAALGGAKACAPNPGDARPNSTRTAGAQVAQAAGTKAEQKPADAGASVAQAADTRPPACATQGASSNNPRSIFGKATVDDAAPAPASAPAPAIAPTSEAASASASGNPESTPVFTPAPSPEGLTPEFKPAWKPARTAATLIDDNRRIEVVDGDTVGCLRQIGEPAPAIALDESDHPYVSQRQALFSCDEGSWSLVSFGRNGTSVQRDGIWTELSTGVPFALRDGDRISFAKSAPLTFSPS